MSDITNQDLFENIKNLIEQTKQNVLVAVNSSMTLMYWNIGKTINDEILQNQRAQYGKEIVATLSQQLKEQYDKGYSKRNIHNKVRFYQIYTKNLNLVEIQHLDELV